MVTIKFLARFKEIAGEKILEVDYTGDLPGLVDLLVKKYGDAFREALLNKDGEFKDYVKILINGEDVNTLQLEDNLGKDDEVVIFQTIAGG